VPCAAASTGWGSAAVVALGQLRRPKAELSSLRAALREEVKVGRKLPERVLLGPLANHCRQLVGCLEGVLPPKEELALKDCAR